MKRIGLYLILGAIVLAVLDFLIPGNSNFLAPSKQLDLITLIVLIVAGLLFLIGLIKLIRDLFLSKWLEKRHEKIKQEIAVGERATHGERVIRIILAILTALLVVPISVLVPFLGIIISIPNILLALYLLLSRRHHLIINTLLFLIGVYLCFFSGNNFFQSYKMAELSSTPGFGEANALMQLLLGILSVGGKFLFMLAASWLVLGDILVKIKNQIFSRTRGLANFASLLVLAIILLLLPYVYQPKVKLGQGSGGGTSGNGASHFAMNNMSTDMAYDQNSRQYVFTATLENATDQTGPIVRIVVDGQDLEISPSNKNLTIANGTVSNNLIEIAAGQTGILKIFSAKPFYCISLLEKDFRYSNCFLK